MPVVAERAAAVVNRTYNVLFLCTGNSARSIMAEVLLNEIGGGRFKAYSAGSHPKGAVHPLALDLLAGKGLAVSGLRSKNWDEFARPEAPRVDFVITVCDNAASEACPVWPGHPLTAHWGIADPAAVAGTPDERRSAFAVAYDALARRIALLVNLPFAELHAPLLKRRLDEIGNIDDRAIPS